MKDTGTEGTGSEQTARVNTLMLIDDDQDCIFISKRLLSKAGFGGETLTAQNGLDALNQLQARARGEGRLPEVILLDVKMPVMDGFGLLEALAGVQGFDLRHTRVYMCSSSISRADTERASTYSVAGFVTKPITRETLLTILG